MIQVLPAHETPWGKLIGTWVGAGIVLIAIWLAAGVQWARFLLPSGNPQLADIPLRLAPLLIFVSAIALSVTILVHYLIAAFERSRTAEKKALKSQVLAREAELKSLRSQLDPHFLFNALNSVAALIGNDTVAARRMCYLMAGFFRKSVALGKEESIPFAEEMQLIETFLAIEEVRFGDRLRKKFDIDKDTLNLAVPPLLLQPLVENAVHHGIAHLLEGGEICITARRREGLLELTVQNPCDPDRPPSKGTGTGLQNVRARLDAVYGRGATAEAHASATGFRVALLVPAIEIARQDAVAKTSA
jgi:LytS/YehU family sensor histidine kinase